MTNVAFHFNVIDKVAYACRLLRKATKQGAKVAVTGDDHVLTLLDDMLWTFDPLEFLPHCDMTASQSMRQRTSIILTNDATNSHYTDVLVNLGEKMPDGFERYLRLIELVSTDPSDRSNARQRWRHYNSRGYSIETFEVNA